MAIIEENGRIKVSEIDPVQEAIVDLVHSLTQERKRRHLSQVMLAEITEMPQSTISRVESLRTVPTIQVLIKMATALDLSLRFIHIEDKMV